MVSIIGRSARLSSSLLRYTSAVLPASGSSPASLCQHEITRRDDVALSAAPTTALTLGVRLGTLSTLATRTAYRGYAASAPSPPSSGKLSVFQRMKQLYKDYWHVLIPVHLITSAGWVGIFYIAAKNGVDIVAIMKYLHISEKYIELVHNSGAGHWAVVYALYKLVTPLRYIVTVGGTTVAIGYLRRWGYMHKKQIPPMKKSSAGETSTSVREAD
ncbi:uncharacterized protein C18orf19 homolog A isoform X2 [Orussus abietinus]|uniref:uncharacterized protein C18orf19 homolog A isoform X2 n=1 Tax=Orussus abietinus TaxID=222816 RepID=UPI000624FCF2|nr:uncharacterized protein C18orf19 homolog A isoform X2 [Orussus abietinus]